MDLCFACWSSRSQGKLCFQQFERALSTDQDKLTIDEPLTPKDCRFLKQAYFSCNEDSTMLDLTDFTKDDIQGYGVVFKRLDDFSDEKWSELEMDLYGPE
ncbi:hypothetical protein ACROYT_G013928 [Oculina patagonica]